MSGGKIEELVARAEESYRKLLAEASTLLKNFDTLRGEEIAATMSRRENILAELRHIDTSLRQVLAAPEECLEEGTAGRLGEFRTFREATTARIRELDALVMAFARERLAAMREELDALARGKVALKGYERKGEKRSCRVNSSA